MVSGNDAAVALAEYVGNDLDGFSLLMNSKAKELNLLSTHFVSPHGLDHENHYTTAYELAKLTDYALQNEIFSKIVNTDTYTININNSPKNLHNTNELLGYIDGVYGVKTGFTNGANRCLVSACKRNNIDVISIVLGCDTKKDRTLDSINLINYTFENYESVNIKEIIENNFNSWKEKNVSLIKTNKGTSNDLDLYIDTSQIINPNYLILKNTDNKINTQIEINSNLQAPIDSASTIGKMKVYYDSINDIPNSENTESNLIFSVNIKNKNAILRKDIYYYMHYFLSNYTSYFSNVVNWYKSS